MPGTENTWFGIFLLADSVTEINLNNNNLSGSLPSELGDLSNMRYLNLYNNKLLGSIPSQLGNLGNLISLSLHHNQLSGTIPDQLANLSNLESLNLHVNQLNGNIPAALGNLPKIKWIALSNNQFNGSIPIELGDLNFLETLSLDDNQLTGNIPAELANIGTLKSLSLSENQLDGSIPTQFSKLDNLHSLFLYENQLSGSIPKELADMDNLKWVNISYNQLTGTIPVELASITTLQALSLHNNQLNGNIPPELGNLADLYLLSLGNNQLTGSIPSEIGNLTELQNLYLTNNQLNGAIPSELGNNSKLKFLYLSSNKLSGEIPSNLTNLSSLITLDLGYNCLTASDPTLRTWLDTNDPDWEDNQNQCAGSSPSITVVSPNGGESWNIGSTQTILWSSTGTIENVKLEYSLDSGSNWFTISDSSANIGYHYWTIPDKQSSQCRVKVSAVDDPDTWDSSDADFTISMSGSQPTISLNRTKMYFTATPSGVITKQQHSWLYNTGTGTLNWTVTSNASWIRSNGENGIDDGIIYISVDPTGLSTGSYIGTVSVSAPNASNSPQSIEVYLNIIPEVEAAKPFGDFATPIDNSTVSSSIPVTGWALDDIGIDSVKIYRETADNSLAYIGDAVFVEGARPDVQDIYTNYPNNYKAGWGYMLLTNFLPNGNGEFTLHAIATDMEGESVTLGTKKISVDNDNAVKPFGAIDTPGQGEFLSGNNYINWGWALTPQPNMIPTDGSTINVWVDGEIIGQPVYNLYRQDIATLFPGYANSDGAVGYFYLDTTKLVNGRHSISWYVKDSGNNYDGIGSRYISVLNPGSKGYRQSQHSSQFTSKPLPYKLSNIKNNHLEPVSFSRGTKNHTEPQIIFPDENGRIIITAREMEKINIQFFNPAKDSNKGTYIHPLTTLPIGSNLDSISGTYSWQLGVGFVGSYEFTFIQEQKDNHWIKRIVLINILPKFSSPQY
jgi:Leucine-rich repeat (LRR) protein